MSDHAALVQLAGMIGVETRYRDALGETHDVSDDTLLALIAALGLPSDPIRARRELQSQLRSRPLGLREAYVVEAEDESPQITLRLPAGCRQMAWRCQLEDGEARSGRVAADTRSSRSQFTIQLPEGLPLGYHRLEVEADNV